MSVIFALSLPVFFQGFLVKGKNKINISGTYVPHLQEVDNRVVAFMERWKIPGATVALIKDHRIIYNRGFGNADENVAMLPDYLFRIASLSKPVTAVAIMQLAEQGKISLSQKVFGIEGVLNDEKFLQLIDARLKNITIAQLLSHTAGWDRNGSCGDPMFDPVHIARVMKAKAPANTETVIQYMLRRPLDFDPGTHYAYSNLGYAILGRVIEKVSGKSYEHFVKENILKPAHVKDMQLGRNLFCDKNCKEVKYYDYSNRKVSSVCQQGVSCAFPYGGFNLEAMDAHGGWIASAADLANFLIATDSNNENSLLSKYSHETMTTLSAANKNYGLGWCVNAKGNKWHTGSLPGTSSMMAQLSNGTGWVLLFNSNPGSGAYFAELDRLMHFKF